MEEVVRITLFSDGLLIDGKVGVAGLLCVNGVVKRSKGLRLGSAGSGAGTRKTAKDNGNEAVQNIATSRPDQEY